MPTQPELALIGFVFLCPASLFIAIISFHINTYAHFACFEIGFVFSNPFSLSCRSTLNTER